MSGILVTEVQVRLTNPSHHYAAKGQYDISLVVSNTYGCSSTITKPAFINAAELQCRFYNAIQPTAREIQFFL